MSKLTHSLQKWQNHGLLSADQAAAILQFEQKSGHLQLIYRSFLLLGFFVVAIGVTAIVAVNWALIPASLKLLADFVLLSFTAVLIAYFNLSSRKSIVWSDSLIFFYLLLCLASIGLIVQIYNLDLPVYRAVLFWAIFTFPLLFFVTRGWIIAFWVSALAIVLPSNLVNSRLWPSHYPTEIITTTISVAYPLLLLNILLLLHTRNLLPKLNQIISFWQVVFLLIPLAILDFSISQNISFLVAEFQYLLLPALVLGLIAILLISFIFQYSLSQKILLSLIIVVYLLFLWIAKSFVLSPFVGILFSVSLLGLLAIYFALTQHKIAFHLMILLIMLRFLLFYFEHVRGLLSTGIGLIVTGVLVIASVSLWYYIYNWVNARFVKKTEVTKL